MAQVAKGIPIESNPFRSEIPSTVDDLSTALGDFLREQAQNLRQQHNLIQAGDTTCQWELLTELTSQQLFTLGSVGRFFNAEFGLVVCRYVQFEEMVETDNVCSPVGQIKATEFGLWRVTNDLGASDSGLVFGIIGAYEIPTDGQYGWVIVDGVNLQTLGSDSTGGLAGEEFVWGATGLLGTSGLGRVIGRRIQTQSSAVLAPGMFRVQLESWSRASIQQAANDAVAPVQAQVTELAQDITDIQTAIGTSGLQGQINALILGVDALESGLATEAEQRMAGDRSVLNTVISYGYVDQVQLNTTVQGINVTIEEMDSRLTAVSNEALAKANQALILATSIVVPDLGPLNDAIVAILVRLGDLTFLSLADTPDAYTGEAGKVVTVKGDETGLEFRVLAASEISFTPITGISSTNVQAAIAELAAETVVAVVSSDNAVARFDGTAGQIQNSSAVGIDDNNRVGIGTLTPSSRLHLAGNLTATLGSTPWNIFGASVTVNDSVGSGTVANMIANRLQGGTITASNTVTYTTASTLLVDPPVASTNVTFTDIYALNSSGRSRFADQLNIGGSQSYPSWTTTGRHINVLASTLTNTTSSGTVTTQVASAFGIPAFAASSSTTVTNAATVYIGGAPTAGSNMTITNPWSFYVATGKSKFLGAVEVPDDAFSVSWNGSLEVPTKNAVYDEMLTRTKTLFTATASATVSNSVAETTILGSGVGSLTLAANALIAGKTIRLVVGGVYSTPAAASPSLIFKIKLGSTVVATFTTTTLHSGATNERFCVEVLITCRTTGASGTVMVDGEVSYQTVTAGVMGIDPLNNAGATTVVDTTTSQAIGVTVQWDSATSSRSITGTVVIVESLN